MGSLSKKSERSARERVLIIDEGSGGAVALKNALSTNGFVTRLSGEGGDAVGIIGEWHPSVVLLELAGSVSALRETCGRIRAMDLPYRPSIMVVSEKTAKQDLLAIVQDGADDFIFKPVDEAELNARVKEQLKLGGVYRSLQEEKNSLRSLLEISNAISTTLKPRDVLKTIVSRVAEATGAERCSIVLISEDDEGYVLASQDDPDLRDLRIDLAKYPEIQEAVRTKSPFFADEITTHPVMAAVKESIGQLKGKSVLIVPIVFNDRVLGTIFLRTKKKAHGFSREDIDFCKIVANTAYNAIRNARIYQKLYEEREYFMEAAIRDHLTSMYNHNHFYLRLGEDFERASRYGTPLSLIMMDIDNFKKINDTHGHRIGDAVLKEIAATVKDAIRRSDIAARYGGEEFAIILPHTGAEGASGEAERLRKLLEEHSYKDLPEVRITVSLGVASCPNKAVVEPGDLVTLADDALYRAKYSGRNRVVVAGEAG